MTSPNDTQKLDSWSLLVLCLASSEKMSFSKVVPKRLDDHSRRGKDETGGFPPRWLCNFVFFHKKKHHGIQAKQGDIFLLLTAWDKNCTWKYLICSATRLEKKWNNITCFEITFSTRTKLPVENRDVFYSLEVQPTKQRIVFRMIHVNVNYSQIPRFPTTKELPDGWLP